MNNKIRCTMDTSVIKEPCCYCCLYCENYMLCVYACTNIVEKHLNEKEIAKECVFAYEEE